MNPTSKNCQRQRIDRWCHSTFNPAVLLMVWITGCGNGIVSNEPTTNTDPMIDPGEGGVETGCVSSLDCFPGYGCFEAECAPYDSVCDLTDSSVMSAGSDRLEEPGNSMKEKFYNALRDQFVITLDKNLEELNQLEDRWADPTVDPEGRGNDLRRWKSNAFKRKITYQMMVNRISPLEMADPKIPGAAIEQQAMYFSEILGTVLSQEYYNQTYADRYINNIAAQLKAFESEGVQLVSGTKKVKVGERGEIQITDQSIFEGPGLEKAIYIDIQKDIGEVLEAPVECRFRSRIAQLPGLIFKQTDFFRAFYRSLQLEAPILDWAYQTFPKKTLDFELENNPMLTADEFAPLLKEAVHGVRKNIQDLNLKLSWGGEWYSYSSKNLDTLGEANMLVQSVMENVSDGDLESFHQVAAWHHQRLLDQSRNRTIVYTIAGVALLAAPLVAPALVDVGLVFGIGISAKTAILVGAGYSMVVGLTELTYFSKDAYEQWGLYRTAQKAYYSTLSEADSFSAEVASIHLNYAINSILSALGGGMSVLQGIRTIYSIYNLRPTPNGLTIKETCPCQGETPTPSTPETGDEVVTSVADLPDETGLSPNAKLQYLKNSTPVCPTQSGPEKTIWDKLVDTLKRLSSAEQQKSNETCRFFDGWMGSKTKEFDVVQEYAPSDVPWDHGHPVYDTRSFTLNSDRMKELMSNGLCGDDVAQYWGSLPKSVQDEIVFSFHRDFKLPNKWFIETSTWEINPAREIVNLEQPQIVIWLNVEDIPLYVAENPILLPGFNFVGEEGIAASLGDAIRGLMNGTLGR